MASYLGLQCLLMTLLRDEVITGKSRRDIVCVDKENNSFVSTKIIKLYNATCAIIYYNY